MDLNHMFSILLFSHVVYFVVRMKRAVVLFDEPLTTASLERKLVRLGFGIFQLQTIVACGFLVFYHSAITTLNRELLEQSKSPFVNDGIERLVFAITPYFGSVMGCLVSSTDWFSRKFLIIFSYAVIGLFTLMAAMSNTTSSLYITIMWLGLAHVGFGLGFPSAILTVYESSPVNRRPVALSLLFTFHIIGEVFVGIMNRLAPLFPSLCSSHNPSCNYRLFGFESVAIPMFIALILSAFWVHESPISLQSDCFKLNTLLRHIRETNGLVESDVVVKFVPKSEVKKLDKISTLNVFILGSIFFVIESFQFIFPHPDNHWIVSAIFGLVALAVASGVCTFIYRSTRPISILLFFLSALCVLGALSSTTKSAWGHYVQSWFVLGVLKACSLSLFVFTTVFVCELSSRYISQILAIAFTGCILFPNSIELTSSVPIEIIYAVLFGIVGIAVSAISSTSEKEANLDTMGKFSKIPLIGQLPQRNYGISGA